MATAAAEVHDAAPAPSRRQQASSALATTRRNVNYLLDPKAAPAPGRFRTRTLLRTCRYIGIFIFWRVVRSLKYAAVGALTAALAGTALGTITGGIGFVLAPPGILTGGVMGLVWGLGKFGWKSMARRVRAGDVERDARRDEHADERVEEEERRSGIAAQRAVVRVDPW